MYYTYGFYLSYLCVPAFMYIKKYACMDMEFLFPKFGTKQKCLKKENGNKSRIRKLLIFPVIINSVKIEFR